MSVGMMALLKDFHFVLGTTAPATSVGQPPGGLRTRTGTTRTTQVTVRSEEIKKFALKDTSQSRVWPGVQGWAADTQHVQHVTEVSQV